MGNPSLKLGKIKADALRKSSSFSLPKAGPQNTTSARSASGGRALIFKFIPMFVS
jgi:hypothetical protein